jgi:hypothetical protein
VVVAAVASQAVAVAVEAAVAVPVGVDGEVK